MHSSVDHVLEVIFEDNIGVFSVGTAILFKFFRSKFLGLYFFAVSSETFHYLEGNDPGCFWVLFEVLGSAFVCI